MNIVVTGGAGFIGSHLCEFFLDKGHKVICIDNLITGTKENIKHSINNPKFEFINHDVSKYITLHSNVDWVLHFASPASPIDYQKYPIQTLKVGSLGTHNSLGFAKEKGAGFFLASTSEVYGDPLINPQTEDYWGNVNPIGPRGVYDEAKRFAEALTMAYHRYHNIDTRICRIFNTYGERMRINDGRVVPNLLTQAITGQDLTIYGNGLQTRSFCYISDLIDGIWRSMSSKIHNPMNLGNPEELTVLEFAEIVLKITGSKSKITYHPLPTDDPKVRRPDITIAKEKLGWEPKISLEQGLKRTIKYFKSKI